MLVNCISIFHAILATESLITTELKFPVVSNNDDKSIKLSLANSVNDLQSTLKKHVPEEVGNETENSPYIPMQTSEIVRIRIPVNKNNQRPRLKSKMITFTSPNCSHSEICNLSSSQ